MAASRRADVRRADHRGRRGGRVLRVAEAPVRAAAARRPCPTRHARRRSLAAIAGTVPPLWLSLRRLPLHAALRPRVRRLPDDAAGALRPRPTRSVRCLLYTELAAADGPPSGSRGLGRSLSGRQRRRRAEGIGRAARRIAPLLRGARTSPSASRSGAACCSGRTGVFSAVDGISFDVAERQDARAGRRIRVAARPRPARRSSSCCAAPRSSRAAHCFAGQDLFTLEGDALRAARREIQIIFQDPFASLNPRMRVLAILEEGLQALRPEMDAARAPRRLEAPRRPGGPAPRRARPLSARIFGRPAPAHRDRAGARGAAEAHRLRRADVGARRLGAGADPQPAAPAAARARPVALFITHNIGVVEYLADDIVVMQRGRVEEKGPTERCWRMPQSAYTRTLLAAVPRIERRCLASAVKAVADGTRDAQQN